jgi:hypothetical protein
VSPPPPLLPINRRIAHAHARLSCLQTIPSLARRPRESNLGNSSCSPPLHSTEACTRTHARQTGFDQQQYTYTNAHTHNTHSLSVGTAHGEGRGARVGGRPRVCVYGCASEWVGEGSSWMGWGTRRMAGTHQQQRDSRPHCIDESVPPSMIMEWGICGYRGYSSAPSMMVSWFPQTRMAPRPTAGTLHNDPL